MPATYFYFDVSADFTFNQAKNLILDKGSGTGVSHITTEGQLGYNVSVQRAIYHNGTTTNVLVDQATAETLTNKTLTSPVIDTGVSGSAIQKSVAGGGLGIRAVGSASDILIPTEKAVSEALADVIAAGNAMVWKGGFSAPANYPAANCGDTYTVTSAGLVGGAGGPTVEVGDQMTCTTDGTVTGTHAAVGAYWVVIQSNIDVLPTAKGGFGRAITPVIGDILYADTTSTFQRLAKGTSGYVLTMGASLPAWTAIPAPTGAALTGSNDTNITLSFGANASVALLAATQITVAWASTLSVARGGTGGALTTVAGGVIWASSTTLMACTAAGSAGQHLQSAGTGAPTWTSVTYPSTAAQGDILYASATNVYSHLAKSTTAGHYLKNSGGSNNPVWGAIAIGDLPNGVVKAFKADYTAATTLSIAAGTHGFGTPWKIMVQFYRLQGTTYVPAAAGVTINSTTGEVIVTTTTAQTGYVVISQVIGNP